MLPLGIIILVCGLIGIYATWTDARVAFLRRKKQLSAYEAKLISEKFDSKMKKVESGIYEDIHFAAFCGNRGVRSIVDGDADVSFETIAWHLKRKGYSVTWNKSEQSNDWIFDIQW